jgi:hypothetical protein
MVLVEVVGFLETHFDPMAPSQPESLVFDRDAIVSFSVVPR